MRTITWKVVMNDSNQIASMESAEGFPKGDISSHLQIIGLLENLKQQHINQLNVLYSKTIKGKGLIGKENDEEEI